MEKHSDSLSVEGVSVRLGKFRLNDITFAINPGEVVGYLGHNGSGKTTTFRVIADIVRPQRGVVRLGVLDHRADEAAFKERVGIVGDNKSIYRNFRVGEVLQFAAAFYRQWDQPWCLDVCQNLHLPLTTQVKHLSTGMRAKLALILQLSAQPEFLVLDEPTSGLDAESAEWLWRLLRQRRSRRPRVVALRPGGHQSMLARHHLVRGFDRRRLRRLE